jgi:hypothetical protein
MLWLAGIRQETRAEVQVRREERQVFVKTKGGLCNQFDYW